MMKTSYFFTALILVLFASGAGAQDTSYQKILSAKDDTAKVNRLHEYAQNLLNKDNKSANEIYKITVALSEKLGYDLGVATAWRKIGYINGQEGKYKDAIDCFRKAIYFYTTGGGHLKDLLVCYNNIGANFLQFGKVDSAMHYYLMAIKKIEGWPLDKEDIAIRTDMLSTLSLLHENMSTMYSNQFNVPKALEYGLKGLSIAKEINDTSRIVLTSISTSHAYYVNKEWGKALQLAREAANLAELIDAPVALSKAYHLLSVNYTSLNKPDSGIYAAKKAMALAKETDQQLYITSLLDLADAYHDKKSYGEEAALLQSALKEFKTMNNVVFGRNVYEKLAMAKYALGQYKEAYDYYTTANVFKDSMLSAQNREAVAALEVQYQTAQKEKALVNQQLQLTQKNLQLQKSGQYIIYSISALLIALMAAGLLWVRSRYKRRQHERQLISIQQQQELHLLQAVINGEEKERSRIAKDLHDGVAGMLAAVKMHFSTIADVKVLQHMDGFQHGMALLNETALEIRKTAHNLMPEILLAHGLDAAMQRYCNNISNTKLQIQYDSWGDLLRYKESFELAVYRIVQELIHNVVKHSKASQAIVQMSVQGHLLSITIEDNGVGFQSGEPADGTGIQTLQQRVKAMNGKFDIEGEGGSGVSAYLEFDTRGLELPVSKDTQEIKSL